MSEEPDLALYALKRIAEHPTEQRNPDGDEQAAWAMREIAGSALEQIETAPPSPQPSKEGEGDAVPSWDCLCRIYDDDGHPLADSRVVPASLYEQAVVELRAAEDERDETAQYRIRATTAEAERDEAQHCLQHEIKVRQDIARSQQAALAKLKRVEEARCGGSGTFKLEGDTRLYAQDCPGCPDCEPPQEADDRKQVDALTATVPTSIYSQAQEKIKELEGRLRDLHEAEERIRELEAERDAALKCARSAVSGYRNTQSEAGTTPVQALLDRATTAEAERDTALAKLKRVEEARDRLEEATQYGICRIGEAKGVLAILNRALSSQEEA